MFNISDKIKLNEELCPENKRTDKRFQFGNLNYLAIMLEWEFEIVRVFENEYHGTMVECKVLNDDKNKSNVALRANDCVLAKKMNIKIPYEILSLVNKSQPEIDTLKATEKSLVATREEKKASGKPITDVVMVANWGDIKNTRAKIKKLEQTSEKIFEVKSVLGVTTFDCKEEQIPSKIRDIIRKQRITQRKIEAKEKVISGKLSYSKVGGVLTKPGEFFRLNEGFAQNIIDQVKVPTTSENYVGIEIEMLSPKKHEDLEKEFIKARLHKYVNLGDDVSIKGETTGFHPIELRVCLPESLLDSHIKLITDLLRKNDCYANRSCGMHVHIDMRNRDPELCYRNFFKVQDIMIKSQPQSRRTNKYCLPNTEASLKLSEFTNDARRSAINTNSYSKNNMKTIEIRIHEGATKFKDVLNWTKFLVGTASLKSDLPKLISTIDELKAASFLTDNVINHLDERIQEYSA